MTKRDKLIALMRLKAKNGDIKGAMRIYIENKCISYRVFKEAIQ